MSTLPWNAGDSRSSSLCSAEVPKKFFPAGVADKKSAVLSHISSYKRLVDVRPASRLELRPAPEMLPTGVAALDALVGGIPRGCLSEICGAASSGKSSLLIATIAAATQREESCVLIDASDSFDPESGAAAGVEFGKLLWVRCGHKLSALSRLQSAKKSLPPGSCSSFAQDSRPTTHENFGIKTRSELRLEQVLKTTDLVLQSGGFGLVVLDLGGISEKFVRRIPLASWFRFQRAVEHTRTALLVISEFACAQTCAAVVLKTSIQHSAFSIQPRRKPDNGPSATSRQPSEKSSHAQLLEEIRIEAEIVRTRLERKPMASVTANFATRAVRAG
jgi:hypothetical protein